MLDIRGDSQQNPPTEQRPPYVQIVNSAGGPHYYFRPPLMGRKRVNNIALGKDRDKAFAKAAELARQFETPTRPPLEPNAEIFRYVRDTIRSKRASSKYAPIPTSLSLCVQAWPTRP